MRSAKITSMLEVYKHTLPDPVKSQLRDLENQYAELNFAFQNVDFFEFYAKQKDAEPFCFVERNQENRIEGYVIAIVLSTYKAGRFGKRCLIWNQLMLFTMPDKTAPKLLSAIKKELAHKVLFIEFRNFELNKIQHRNFENNHFAFRNHIGLRISHANADDAKKHLSESKRRQIKKSLERGVQIKTATSEEEVGELYTILKGLYQSKIKKPLPSLQFFTSFFINGPGVILLVKSKQEIIGGVVLLTEEGKGVYEWYVAGTDFRNKKLYPSVMATWAAIEYTFENKYKFFDFMGGGKPERAYGVRDFKLKFGAQQENTGRWVYTKYRGILKFVNYFSSYNI